MKNINTEATSTKFSELLNIRNYLSSEALLRNFPFLLFLVGLGMVYIGNIHFAERTVRAIDRTEMEFKEMKWEYMSTKAELMFKSKQSEVAKVVEPLGLKELTSPPGIIRAE